MSNPRKAVMAVGILLMVAAGLWTVIRSRHPHRPHVTILCLGDSLTFSPYGSYIPALRERLGEHNCPIRVIHGARPGNNSGEYLRYLRHSRIVDRSAPRFVLLMIGTNDVRIDGDRLSRETFEENMGQMIELIRNQLPGEAKGTRLFVILPPPVVPGDLPTFNRESRRRLAEEIIPATRRVAASKHVPLIDIHSFFTSRPGLLQGIHPGEAGYRAMGQAIYRFLAPFLCDRG